MNKFKMKVNRTGINHLLILHYRIIRQTEWIIVRHVMMRQLSAWHGRVKEMKEIDLNDTVFTIVSAYPKVRDALVKLGFEALKDDKMLHTAGRMMTLARGAKMMGIDQKEIVAVLERLGYEVKEQERND
jgi:hypothetical protein